MIRLAALFGALLGLLACAAPVQTTASGEGFPYEALAQAARQEIAAGHTPGAVILVAHAGQTVFRQAYGARTVDPVAPMTERTIFDLASLTKVVATAPAILQLADRGQLRLDDPVARYWPAFAQNGKDAITVRQLLTHFSGLRVGMDDRIPWSGSDGALANIAADRPVAQPGSRFSYSDVDFIVLGELVRRVSGLDLDVYCAQNLFAPLGMHDTTFNPDPSLQPRIAPTEIIRGELRWGRVQDPIAYRMGGVAGHAGLFSTADDLARFADMIRNHGEYAGNRILSPAAVQDMTSPASPPGSAAIRGLGWDISSRYSTDFTAFSPRSFGHTGYTGTSIWFDPATDTCSIILANRLLPDGKGQVRDLRARVSRIVAETFPPRTANLPILRVAYATANVQTGIDVLQAQRFAPLAGLRIGLITNHTGIDSRGQRTVDVLARAPNLRLQALFSPEHGLAGLSDERVDSSVDRGTGLPVYSLYGATKRPTPAMLAGLDALVFDIQDAGVRYYTYITTLAYAMEAAAGAGLKVFVLDRPNPLNALTVQGPVMEPEFRSFAGYYPLPTRHGMTVGEIARLFDTEARIGADLTVVPMSGYRRASWFDATGLPWINPSPNLRSLTEATLYAGVGLLEGANLSVGRGTGTPFEIVGAPWIDGQRWAADLAARAIPGVRFRPVDFTPSASAYQGRPCSGIRIELVDRDALDPPFLGIELIASLRRLYGAAFQADRTAGMLGSRPALQSLLAGADPRDVRASWTPRLDAFRRTRQAYLLYP